MNDISCCASDFSANQWTEFKFALPQSVNGQIIYPTLYAPYAPGSYSDNIYVDDVTIEVGQTSCMAPHNLQFSNVGGSSVLLSWSWSITYITGASSGEFVSYSGISSCL